MDWITASHLTYLAVTVPLTIWAPARCRSTAGLPRGRLHRQRRAREAINKLLVVGFGPAQRRASCCSTCAPASTASTGEPGRGRERQDRGRDDRARPSTSPTSTSSLDPPPRAGWSAAHAAAAAAVSLAVRTTRRDAPCACTVAVRRPAARCAAGSAVAGARQPLPVPLDAGACRVGVARAVPRRLDRTIARSRRSASPATPARRGRGPRLTRVPVGDRRPALAGRAARPPVALPWPARRTSQLAP